MTSNKTTSNCKVMMINKKNEVTTMSIDKVIMHNYKLTTKSNKAMMDNNKNNK
jgi:hypothetical protein